ncbi:unnamed protein product [Protopolystoma xenopodis]|uniref:Uncharacterized protein n=1 Tax=Protopolystoma xenopodis TaxID=117903 RepID=A0A448X9G6_9PLAT|nr:unnamed protein product [Protopolystoma xenopodis]
MPSGRSQLVALHCWRGAKPAALGRSRGRTGNFGMLCWQRDSTPSLATSCLVGIGRVSSPSLPGLALLEERRLSRLWSLWPLRRRRHEFDKQSLAVLHSYKDAKHSFRNVMLSI